LTILSCHHVAVVDPDPMTSPSGRCSGWRSATIVEVFNFYGVRSPLELLSFGFISKHLGGAFAPPPLVAFVSRSYV